MPNLGYWTTNKFFERLDYFLSAKGWTLNKLCSESDITAASLYSMKNRQTLPTLQTICIICDTLGIGVSDFFNLDDSFDKDSANFIFAFSQLSAESKKALLLLLPQLK